MIRISRSSTRIASTRPGSESLVIVHASDLHHHPTDAFEGIDKKLRIGITHREIDKFWRTLFSMNEPIDFLVISGDISLRGSSEGHTEFAQRLTTLREKQGWPDLSRVVVVPGNHDVVWEVSSRLSKEDRYKSFVKSTEGTRIPRVPGALANREPYAIDPVRRVLIYALNSTLYCGVRETDDKEWESIAKALESIPDSDARKRAEFWAAHRRLHDVAYIEPEDLHEMQGKIAQVAAEPGWTRIAVLHHHLIPLSGGVASELKGFEMTVNAGEILDSLHECGFSIVLHGHKHVPRVQHHFDPERGTKLAIVCAPTAGGTPAQSGNGYYVLRLDRIAGRVRGVVETHNQSGQRSGSPQAILPDQSDFVSWQRVHTRWDRDGVYDRIDSSGAILSTMLAGDDEDIAQICRTATTQFIGSFPDFCPQLTELILSATNSLLIACDFPGFAIFSAPEEFDKYYAAIMKVAKLPKIAVQMRYLGPSGQTTLHNFGRIRYTGNHIEDCGVPRLHLEALQTRLRTLGKSGPKKHATVEEYQALLRVVHASYDKSFREPSNRVEVAHLDVPPPVYLWIADEERAVFSIPRVSRDADTKPKYWTQESGYATEDRSLIERLKMVWKFYDAHYRSRTAEKQVHSSRKRK